MSSKRLFMILIGVMILLGSTGIGGVVYGNIFLQKQTQDILGLKVEKSNFEAQKRLLVQAKKDVEKYSYLETITKTIVPQDKDQARTIREIIKLSQESGIQISTITFPSSNLGQITPKQPVADTTTTPPTTPQTVPKAATTTTTTQVKPVEGITGVYQMEINVQTDSTKPVPYKNLIDFLARLEKNRRTAHVTNITVTPTANNRDQVTFSLIINVYIKP